MAVHSIIVDTTRFDHGRFNSGASDIGYTKMVNQLLVHRFGRRCGQHGPIQVYFDNRIGDSTSLDELRDIANNHLRKAWAIKNRPFRRMTYVCSKKSPLIQATDLILGAIAWHKNEHDTKSGASTKKKALADHIAQKLGADRLGNDRDAGPVTVWNFRLRQ